MRYLLIAIALVFSISMGDAQTPSRPSALDPARGCGAIYTYNGTSNPVWVTIYDPSKSIRMDWGAVNPHSDRRWTGGGTPYYVTAFGVQGARYVCGPKFVVRIEVKGNGANIADLAIPFVPGNSTYSRICLETQSRGGFFLTAHPGCIRDNHAQ